MKPWIVVALLLAGCGEDITSPTDSRFLLELGTYSVIYGYAKDTWPTNNKKNMFYTDRWAIWYEDDHYTLTAESYPGNVYVATVLGYTMMFERAGVEEANCRVSTSTYIELKTSKGRDAFTGFNRNTSIIECEELYGTEKIGLESIGLFTGILVE
jgi:hypothetical protein